MIPTEKKKEKKIVHDANVLSTRLYVENILQ